MNDEFKQALTLRSLARRLLNMACFYGGWFVCIREATGPHPYFGPLLAGILLLSHMAATDVFWVDAILIASFAAIGTLVDSIYIWSGLISYEGGYACCPYLAPLWITSLWALYASSINHSLEWLKVHLILVAAPLGAAGAISSYFVGIKLGAAEFYHSHLVSYGIIGIVWSVLVPLSLLYNGWLKQKFAQAKKGEERFP